eukprot:TRINITY_DN2617_c0_g1_i1.p1 TRINITY_DN2617_c0_g1~~TRINITY_DN2617_c0_g1_i1.p1  ORF type:complete len:716 (-),score=86.93 TRINITY_DN2617_c0_g1_i1:114-2261(-)
MIFSFLLFINTLTASNAALKDDVQGWIDYISNPKNLCAPDLNEEVNVLVSSRYPGGLLDFQTGDCSTDQGYSINYMIDTGSKLKKGTFNGKGSISFHSNSNHGFRTGLCLRSLSNDVLRIDGTFKDNYLQGPFTVYFKGEVSMHGTARDSKIISPVRYFETQGLANVTGEGNNWVQEFGKNSFKMDEDLEYIIDPHTEDLGVVCGQKQSSKSISDFCQDFEISFTRNSCHFSLKTKVTPGSKKFRWNRENNERLYEGDDRSYEKCKEEWTMGEAAKEALKSWFTDLSTLSPDPYWKMHPNPDAIDNASPMVSAQVPEWDRTNMEIDMVLKTQNTVIAGTKNKNGAFEFDLKGLDLDELRREYVAVASKQLITPSGIEYERSSESKLEELLNSKLALIGYLKGGVYHGLVRRWGRLISDTKNNCSTKIFPGLSFVGNYERGVPIGPSWRFLPGGGLLYGDNIQGHEFTGDNLAYVYPDLETTILGRFEKGVLIKGREALLKGVRCTNGGVYEARFSEPEGQEYSYSPPRIDHNFAGDPNLTDPVDSKYVYIKDSSLKDADEGVFASRDIKAGTLISLYCGIVLSPMDLKEFNAKYIQEAKEKGLKEDNNEYYDFMKYHMSFKQCSSTLTIPPELGDYYKYTLGHKFQHSFNPNAAYSKIVDTPRFGPCIGTLSLRDIKKDEELFTNYGYSSNTGIPWFKKLYEETYKTSSTNKVSS